MGRVNATASEPCERSIGGGGIDGGQERAGRQQSKRVKVQGIADAAALGVDRNGRAIDRQPHLRGLGHLVQRGDHTAFRRVVHGVHGGFFLEQKLGRPAHRDSRVVAQADGGGDQLGGAPARPQRRCVFLGEDGRAFDSDAGSQNDRVAHARPRGSHDSVPGHRAQQAADGQGAVQAHGDLRMPANEGHVVRPRGLHQIVHEPARVLRGDSLRQQQRGHQPARPRAGGDQVVLVDRQQIAGQLGAAEGDRVRGGDQELVAANVQHGGVLSDGTAEDHVGRRGGQAAKKLSEQIGRQLASG